MNEKQIAGMTMLIGELKSEVSDLQSKLEQAVEDYRNIHNTLDLVNKRLEALESGKRSGFDDFLNKETVDKERAAKLYWTITPKQHAITQLIFFEYTNVIIGNRLNVSEGAAKSYVRQLCESLEVETRVQLRKIYKSIYQSVDEKLYEERTLISKYWAEKYGDMSYQEAKEADPSFNVICKVRYRKSKKIQGRDHGLFEPKVAPE